MKLNLICDPHIEFGGLDLPGGEILLLAGDVCVANYLRDDYPDKDAPQRQLFADFFANAARNYHKVYYILGNHEHYDGVFENTIDIVRKHVDCFANMVVLDNDVIRLNDEYMLFGGTMWTNCNLNDWFAKHAMKKGMNDFYCIKYAGKTLHPEDTIKEYHRTMDRMQDALKAYPDKKFVVMTHHAPTGKSSHARFAGNPMNYGWHNDLDEFILDNPRITHWFHGHTHDTHDYMVGTCRVVCNPRGYVDYADNPDFEVNLEIEI